MSSKKAVRKPLDPKVKEIYASMRQEMDEVFGKGNEKKHVVLKQDKDSDPMKPVFRVIGDSPKNQTELAPVDLTKENFNITGQIMACSGVAANLKQPKKYYGVKLQLQFMEQLLIHAVRVDKTAQVLQHFADVFNDCTVKKINTKIKGEETEVTETLYNVIYDVLRFMLLKDIKHGWCQSLHYSGCITHVLRNDANAMGMLEMVKTGKTQVDEILAKNAAIDVEQIEFELNQID